MAGLFVEPGQLVNEISVHDIGTTETVQLYKDLQPEPFVHLRD